MKKTILTAITTIAILATTANAVSFSDNVVRNACNVFNDSRENFEKAFTDYRTGTEQQIFAHTVGTATGIERAFNDVFGTINVNTLKNYGVGVNTQTTYKNFIINYISFVNLLIDKNLTKEYTVLVAVNQPKDKEFSEEASFLMNHTTGYMNILEPNYLLKNYVVQQTFEFSNEKQKDKEEIIKRIIKLIFLGKTEKAVEEITKISYDGVSNYCSSVGVSIN